MHVRSADGGFDDANKNVIAANFRNGDFFEPEPRLGAAFYDGFHRLLHDTKLGARMKRAMLILWVAHL
jgi:hypothetical protein